ncbi:hypothetical protein ID853_12335 [Xenorhabdus sp. Vera]|uniref:hypothetical protein n=1 Tax=Xenorhabdus koppenhoeferi TaxID=351659 RepID=UPI00199D406D|nr:hypothetical protein [Xenorhabdus sp. Vera]MBD2811655.1 hypothetical protein [Xenorhabdus sp. Vera]
MDDLADLFATILEIFYKIIKYTIKLLAWIFRIAIKNVFILVLSIIVLFCIIFSVITLRLIFGVFMLAMVVYSAYRLRGKIKNYFNKKNSMDNSK